MRLAHRRRREGRTDYISRLAMLKSGQSRFVVRKSNMGMACQLVDHDTKGDKVIIEANSSKLGSFGWKYNTGNIPSAYLTGLLAGSLAKKKGVKSAILDTGLYTSTKASRLYAALAGFADAGIQIPHDKQILPSKDRLTGKHISDYSAKLKAEKPDKYNSIFSAYIKEKLDPQKMAEQFEAVKKKILESK